jgi:hypothetical protein
MMWRFSRRKEEIRLETWYDKYTSEFIADIVHPGGEERESKRFLNQGVFRTWLDTWGRQLTAHGWTQSGPFLFEPEQRDTQAADSAVSAVGVADRVAKTYAHGSRTFDVRLLRTLFGDVAIWTVERAIEATDANRRLAIPGLSAVASSSEATTFAQACDCIARWLEKPGADGGNG